MTRFLFVSLPLLGHLDWGGMLGTATTLQERGQTVAWASEPAVEPTISSAQVPFLPLESSGWRPLPPLPENMPPDQLQALRRRRALDSWLDVECVGQAVGALANLMERWRPDVVVAEPYAAAAALAAERAGLSLAVCGRPALPRPASDAPQGQVAQRVLMLCQHAGVTGQYWNAAQGQIYAPQLHLDFFCRRWYADLPSIAGQTQFVGGRSGPATPAIQAEAPVVLITLGSLFRHDATFFRLASEAVLLEGGQPLVVTGQKAQSPTGVSQLPGLPAGVAVRSWVDLEETLPQVAAVIHHGGVGTTHAALRHGLPQVAVPHAGDQLAQAGRITQAGVGYGLRPSDFAGAARWAVRQLLGNQLLRTQAREWQAELAALGGTEAAATWLEAAFDAGLSVV